MLTQVIGSYLLAIRRWLPLLAAHVFIRIFVSSIMVPIVSIGLAVTLLASDQAALTDQDIARFLFTPAGAIGAVILVSLLLVAIVLDVVIATFVLRQDTRKPMAALRLAAAFAIYSARGLLPFMARFLIKVLVIVLPFAAVAGVIALLFLTEHDINYYLSERPPEFQTAALLIGAVMLTLTGALIYKLSGWAIALHLTVFEDEAASEAFATSQRMMAGHQLSLISRLVGWIAVRSLAAATLGGIAALVITQIADWESGSLNRIAAALLFGGVIYAITDAWISATSNGALAALLNTEFDRARSERGLPTDTLQAHETTKATVSPKLLMIAVLALSILSFGGGGVLMTQLDHTAKVEIIAHRGAAALAPENTMASVMQALQDDADWIEIDVQENADGNVIVAHDSDFMKAARVPTKVWDITNDDLGTLDVGSWFDPRFAGERVPRLTDVLDAARGRARVIIELKYYGHDQDLERRVARIVEEAGMTDQISTMSLKYPAVQKMRELRPDWRAGILAATFVGNISNLEGDFLALNQAQITSRVVQNADAAGKDVYAWTVNDPLTISRMLWVGVDGLITDDPAFARSVVNAYNDLTVLERLMLAFGDGVDLTLDGVDAEELRP